MARHYSTEDLLWLSEAPAGSPSMRLLGEERYHRRRDWQRRQAVLAEASYLMQEQWKPSQWGTDALAHELAKTIRQLHVEAKKRLAPIGDEDMLSSHLPILSATSRMHWYDNSAGRDMSFPTPNPLGTPLTQLWGPLGPDVSLTSAGRGPNPLDPLPCLFHPDADDLREYWESERDNKPEDTDLRQLLDAILEADEELCTPLLDPNRSELPRHVCPQTMLATVRAWLEALPGLDWKEWYRVAQRSTSGEWYQAGPRGYGWPAPVGLATVRETASPLADGPAPFPVPGDALLVLAVRRTIKGGTVTLFGLQDSDGRNLPAVFYPPQQTGKALKALQSEMESWWDRMAPGSDEGAASEGHKRRGGRPLDREHEQLRFYRALHELRAKEKSWTVENMVEELDVPIDTFKSRQKTGVYPARAKWQQFYDSKSGD